MKDKLFKRRKHVDWSSVVFFLEDHRVTGYYYMLLQRTHYRLSSNRLAYASLLHYYDKKILDSYRLTSDLTVFTRLQENGLR